MAFTSNLILLYPIATLAFIAMRLSNVPIDGRSVGWGTQALRLIILILFCLVMMGLGIRASIGAFVWIFLAGFIGLVLYFKDQRMRRMVVSRGLALATEQHQAVRLARLYAQSLSGGIARRARRMAQLMEMGVSRSSAMESAGLSGNQFAAMSLRLRDKFGIRAQDNSQIDPSQMESDFERAIGQLSLSVLPLALIPIVFTFFWLRQANNLSFIFTSNGMVVPSGIGAIPYPMVTAIALLLFAGLSLILFMMCLLWLNPTWARQRPWRWLFGSYYQCVGLVGLAHVLTRYDKLDEACENTAAVTPAAHIAARYFKACHLLRKGMSIEDSFRKARICSAATSRLFAKASTGNLPWVAEEVARQSYDLMLDRCRWLVVGISISLTITAATPIGLLAIALVQFLTGLSQFAND